jgi:hypothetical protein
MTMGLAAIYDQLFGKAAAEKAAEVKKAEPAAAVAEAPAAEAKAEETAEMTDEQLDKALEGMTDEQLQALAKEVAVETKASQAATTAENEKLAEEYFAAGRIFAQGFISEVNGGEKVATPATEKQTAVQKFAALLEKELQAK